MQPVPNLEKKGGLGVVEVNGRIYIQVRVHTHTHTTATYLKHQYLCLLYSKNK